MKLPRASLAALLGAQAQVTFNDCAAKLMLVSLAQQLAHQTAWDEKVVVGLIGGPVTVITTAQLPIFDTNYAVFAFAGLHVPSFLPSAGLGISLLNVHVLPILP